MTATARFSDVARFGPEEPEEVVAAALACQACLRAPAAVLVVEDGPELTAVCHCPRCDVSTEVALDGRQALRLALAPPSQMLVQFVG